jgi:hypothetical protein
LGFEVGESNCSFEFIAKDRPAFALHLTPIADRYFSSITYLSTKMSSTQLFFTIAKSLPFLTDLPVFNNQYSATLFPFI